MGEFAFLCVLLSCRGMEGAGVAADCLDAALDAVDASSHAPDVLDFGLHCIAVALR